MNKSQNSDCLNGVLQSLLAIYNELRSTRDNTESSTEAYESLERQLSGMRRQAAKLIEEVAACAMARWERDFGLRY